MDRLKLTHLVDTSIQANAVGVGQLKVSAVRIGSLLDIASNLRSINTIF